MAQLHFVFVVAVPFLVVVLVLHYPLPHLRFRYRCVEWGFEYPTVGKSSAI
jgi:hypothetical protein